MRQASRTLPLVAAIGLVAGCMIERPLPPPDDGEYSSLGEMPQRGDDDALAGDEAEEPPFETPAPPPFTGNLTLQSPELSGSVGDVGGLRSENVTSLDGWSEAHWASITTLGDGDNGSAMAILELEGGIAHPDLAPGARLVFRLGEPAPGDLFIYTVGCSGPAQDRWEFDEPAEETIVEVGEDPEDPNVLAISYEARFADGSRVRGAFELVRE